MHLILQALAQVEAKLEQEAEEPHVPLDLAFKQGETIKVQNLAKKFAPMLMLMLMLMLLR